MEVAYSGRTDQPFCRSPHPHARTKTRRCVIKAVRFVSVKEPLEFQDVEKPKPDADQVLVEVAGCGVCHTDIGFWIDGVPTKKPVPLTLGHEISGTVVETGAEFAHLLNKEVIIPAVIPCGKCDLCQEGRGNVCRSQIMPGNDIDGGFAEYIAVPGRGLCVLDDKGDYQLSELSVVADAVTTPYQAVVRSGLRPGDLAIVIGVGGVGNYCCQIAAAFGARVVAIDVDQGKLDQIADHGAKLTLNSTKFDFRSLKGEIKSHAKEWRCRPHSWKIFECSGHPDGQQTAFGLLTFASTLMIVGFTLAKNNIRLSNLMAFDANIQGTWGCKPELYPEAMDLLINGKINMKPFIKTFPLSQGPQVIADVADHKIFERAILVPD